MNPDIEICEKTLREISVRLLAIWSILAFGAIKLKEAVKYVCKQLAIYDFVDLLSFQKNWHTMQCAKNELSTISCVLIFKIGVNQQSHI
jgi:hypothetical protein